jgi:hypothetical protein
MAIPPQYFFTKPVLNGIPWLSATDFRPKKSKVQPPSPDNVTKGCRQNTLIASASAFLAGGNKVPNKGSSELED